jgi:hypothetical protein
MASNDTSSNDSTRSRRPFLLSLGAVLVVAAVMAIAIGLAVGYGGSDCPSEPERKASANCR